MKLPNYEVFWLNSSTPCTLATLKSPGQRQQANAPAWIWRCLQKKRIVVVEQTNNNYLKKHLSPHEGIALHGRAPSQGIPGI